MTGVATATGAVAGVKAVVVVVEVVVLVVAAVAEGAGMERDFLTVLSSYNAVEDVEGRVPYQPTVGWIAKVRCSLWRMGGGGRIEVGALFVDVDVLGRREARTVRVSRIP